MNLRTILASLAIPSFLAGAAAADTEATFEPTHVERAGGFHLSIPPDKAIGLFTAPGERLWAPGWDPTILSGNGTEEGTVFVTEGHGHGTTIWVVVDFDTERFRARYARTTPGVKAGTVAVNLQSDGEGGTEVHVTYELTALSEAGNKDLADFDESAYATMMKEWKHHIQHADPKIKAHFGE